MGIAILAILIFSSQLPYQSSSNTSLFDTTLDYVMKTWDVAREYTELKAMSVQMKNVIQDLTSTENSRGRAFDEKRIISSSVVLAIASTPRKEVQETKMLDL